MNSSKKAKNATEGSGFLVSWQANIGDTISFDYKFKSYDYAPYSDFSFYSINQNTYSLIALGENNVSSGTTTGSFSHTISAKDITNNTTEPLGFSVGVVDVVDTWVNTFLEITDFIIQNKSNVSDLDILTGLAKSDPPTNSIIDNKEIKSLSQEQSFSVILDIYSSKDIQASQINQDAQSMITPNSNPLIPSCNSEYCYESASDSYLKSFESFSNNFII